MFKKQSLYQFVLLLCAATLGIGCSASADDLVEERRPVDDFHGIHAAISGQITLERGGFIGYGRKR